MEAGVERDGGSKGEKEDVRGEGNSVRAAKTCWRCQSDKNKDISEAPTAADLIWSAWLDTSLVLIMSHHRCTGHTAR